MWMTVHAYYLHIINFLNSWILILLFIRIQCFEDNFYLNFGIIPLFSRVSISLIYLSLYLLVCRKLWMNLQMRLELNLRFQLTLTNRFALLGTLSTFRGIVHLLIQSRPASSPFLKWSCTGRCWYAYRFPVAWDMNHDFNLMSTKDDASSWL